MGVLVLVLSNTKVVHRLDCSSARIFASTNLNPPPHAPALRVVVVVVVCRRRRRRSARALPMFCLHFTAFCHGFKSINAHQPPCTPNHGLHMFTPTIAYTKPPFTPTTVYTNHPLHQTKVYTNRRLHHTTVYTNHRLHTVHLSVLLHVLLMAPVCFRAC